MAINSPTKIPIFFVFTKLKQILIYLLIKKLASPNFCLFITVDYRDSMVVHMRLRLLRFFHSYIGAFFSIKQLPRLLYRDSLGEVVCKTVVDVR